MTLQALRPYADLNGFVKSIEYRSGPAAAFSALPIDGDRVNQIVRVDDLRLIPRHEFKLTFDHSRLTPHYKSHASQLFLVVLTRDSMLRREVVLAKFALKEVPGIIAIRPEDLRITGHRDRLPLEFVVVASPAIRGGKALPTQQASRLTHLHVTLANASGGASFPYKRASAAEIEARELPPETAVHLELLGGYEELIKATDTPTQQLFQVWINEKLWDALQNDRSSASSQLRMLAVTETTATLLISAALPAVKNGACIEDGSVIGQLITFVAKQTSSDSATLRSNLESTFALSEITPYLQAAFRYATISSKTDDDGGAE
jgi:hypothetical protein